VVIELAIGMTILPVRLVAAAAVVEIWTWTKAKTREYKKE
jgi:hypothetical protein